MYLSSVINWSSSILSSQLVTLVCPGYITLVVDELAHGLTPETSLHEQCHHRSDRQAISQRICAYLSSTALHAIRHI